jgi:hypothetical protein
MSITLATEEEATQKWCPFARVLLPVNQAGNRVSTFHMQLAEKSGSSDAEHYRRQVADCNCIGSRCMAWRWAGYRRIPSTICTDQDEAHGYCGISGNPTITIGTDNG